MNPPGMLISHLAIVDELSCRWGCDQVPGLPAKSVWALLKAR